LEGDKETVAAELVREEKKLVALSPSVGKYDLCVFVVARSIAEIDDLRRSIREKRGVKRVAVNIWINPHFNFESCESQATKELTYG
jgi:hypothetical protein